MAWTVCFGLYNIRVENKLMVPSYTPFEAAIYELLARSAFSASLGWVTVACAKGYGGIVNKFLSWGVFQPLARLSYMAYLCHMIFLLSYMFSRTYETPAGYWPHVSCDF